MERYFDHVTQGLGTLGHSVTVLTSELDDKVAGANPQFQSLPVPVGAKRRKWNRELRSHFRDLGTTPDIILSNSFAAGPIENFHCPLVGIMHGPPLVALISSIRLLIRGRGSLIACVRETLRAGRLYAIQRKLMHACTLLVAVSKQTKESLTKTYGVTPDKIRVISAPVDTELFHPREAKTVVAPHCQNPFRILTAGTLTRQKGFDFVLEAFAELNRRYPKCYRLTVAGQGPEMQHLREKAQRLAVYPHVNFVGDLEAWELAETFRESDLFVLGTLREEGSPLVIAEALASGIAVVATKAGGNRTAVRDGIDGVLVKMGSAGQISSVIERLANNTDLRSQMADNGRRRACAELDKGVIARKTEEVLFEAIDLYEV